MLHEFSSVKGKEIKSLAAQRTGQHLLERSFLKEIIILRCRTDMRNSMPWIALLQVNTSKSTLHFGSVFRLSIYFLFRILCQKTPIPCKFNGSNKILKILRLIQHFIKCLLGLFGRLQMSLFTQFVNFTFGELCEEMKPGSS